ncbi:MAG: trigger factor [Alphaproteobacteria bacterium]
MDVQKKDVTGLKHTYQVKIPANEIEEEVDKGLKVYSANKKIPGFRPGKAPMDILRQRFGTEVRPKVIENMVQSFLSKLQKDNDIRIAGQPRVDFDEYKQGGDLQFNAVIEIYPEIELKDVSKYKFDLFAVETSDKDIESGLKDLADRQLKTEPLSGKRKKSKAGDYVVIDMQAFLGDEKIEEFTANGQLFFLDPNAEEGSRNLVKAMTDVEVGAKIDESIKMSDKHSLTKVAGKDVRFKAEIKDIHEKVETPINDELAKHLGFESLEKLREQMQKEMADRHEKSAFYITKRRVLDKLAEDYSFDLPEGIVEQEFNLIWSQAEKELNEEEKKPTKKKIEDEKKRFRDIAIRRVRQALVLSKIGRENSLKVEDGELRSAIMQEAMRYPGQEREIAEHITKSPQLIEQIQAPIFEEKAIRFIVEKATVKEKKVSFEQLQKEIEKLTEDA